MVVALKNAGVEVEQQAQYHIHYQDVLVGEYVADLIVNRSVVVEIKATELNPPVYVAQVLNYLKASKLPVGLLLNFGMPKLYYRRLTPRA